MSSEEGVADLETEQNCQSWMNLPKSSRFARRMQKKFPDLII